MTIDEAIQREKETYMAIYGDALYGITEGCLTAEEYENCLQQAREHAEMTRWLEELRRLQSIAVHMDEYTTNSGRWLGRYWESQGEVVLRMFNLEVGKDEIIPFYQLPKMSRKQLIEWCENWESTNGAQEGAQGEH